MANIKMKIQKKMDEKVRDFIAWGTLEGERGILDMQTTSVNLKGVKT